MNRSGQRRPRSTPALAFLSVAFGLLLSLGALELTFRLLPVQDVSRHTEIDERYQVNRFVPGSIVTYSSGWNFSVRTVKRANNLGYLDDLDYQSDQSGPVLVAIGDSFVEALQVPNDKTFHGLLQARLGSPGRSFGIGQSGASLADYLAYAAMATKEIRPSVLAFVIVANDFDESDCRYALVKGARWCFHDEASNGALKPFRHPPRSWLRRALADTALWRYASYNLGFNIDYLRQRLNAFGAKTQTWTGNVPTTVPEDRLSAARRSIELFFRYLPAQTNLPADRILLVMDGVRDAIYDNRDISDTFVGMTRRTFVAAALKNGYEVVDMHAVFAAHYALHRERFEFAADRHWNTLGHELVADQIARSAVFSRTFVNAAPPAQP